MKKGSVLLVFILLGCLISSCKECPKCPECPITGQSQTMEHYYKVYNGKVKTDANLSSRNNDIFDFIMFNDSIRKYYKNKTNYSKLTNNNVVDVYQYIQEDTIRRKNDTILVLKNMSLANNSDKDGKKIAARGKYGCIPRFEENMNGDIVNSSDGANAKFIPLMLATHDHSNEVINYLKNYVVRISNSNYDILNSVYQKNKDIEAGINSGLSDTLIVYDDKNQFSLSFLSALVEKKHQ